MMKTLIILSLLFFGFTPLSNSDVTLDGRITITDLVMLRQNLNCDANLDGLTNESDVTFLRYYLANRRN